MPVPPRYWWLKRIAIAVAILLFGVMGLRLYWGRVAERELQQEFARIQAAGRPVEPQDFDPKPVKDVDNAAYYYLEAESVMVATAPISGLAINEVNRDKGEILSGRLDDVAELIEANQEALRLARHARGLEGVDWGLPVRSPMSNRLLPSIRAHRQLAKLLSMNAQYQSAVGNPAGAYESLLDIIRLARAVAEEPSLLGFLVSVSIDSMAVRALSETLPDLPPTASGEAGDNSRAADLRTAIDLLIANLVDDDFIKKSLIRSICYERAVSIDSVRLQFGTLANADLGGAPPPTISTTGTAVIGPLLKLEIARVLRPSFDALLEAAEKPDWPAASRCIAGIDIDNATFPPITSMLKSMLKSMLAIPSERAFDLRFRLSAERRLTGAMLAVWLYAVDRGHPPTTLQELVPDYLDAIPADPFSADGHSIRYDPDSDPPILYSVGMNGSDDGGILVFYRDGHEVRDKGDQVVFLDGRRSEHIARLRELQKKSPP